MRRLLVELRFLDTGIKFAMDILNREELEIMLP